MDGSKFSASYFNVSFSPDNPGFDYGYIDIDINGRSAISGNVLFTLEVIAYGYTVISKVIDPCTLGEGFAGMCPMTLADINLNGNQKVGNDVASGIPGM